MLVLTAALGFAAASPATAATPAWGYEQLSPSDGSSIDVLGIRVSEDGSTVVAVTLGAPMAGMPSDGRGTYFYYGLPRSRAPWPLGPVDVRNGLQANTHVRALSPDGSKAMIAAQLPSVDGASAGVYQVDDQGGAANLAPGVVVDFPVPNAAFDAAAFAGGSGGPPGAYIGRPGQAPVRVSVDNDGNPMSATGLGGATVGESGIFTFLDNSFAADGSSVIFNSRDPFPGDNDIDQSQPWDPVGFKDVFMRVLTPGHEETYSITDVNGSGDVDAGHDASYRWATADHARVFFQTAESLEPGDTDGEEDVYLRDGKDAPVRVSQGETVDGSPTGNGSTPQGFGTQTEWVMSSPDGNRTFFATQERLTQDAPAGDGLKLYERDVAEGRTRFVGGPLAAPDFGDGSNAGVPIGSLIGRYLRDLSYRGLRVTPDGAVFMSSAPLTDSSIDDGQKKAFAWTRDAGLVQIGIPDADAPAAPPGNVNLLPYPTAAGGGDGAINVQTGGRVVSDDGSQVVFSTSQPLTAEDTDGSRLDLYVWSKDEGVRLVSPPGRGQYDANYIESSADGSRVWFNTAESILPTDTDPNAVDVYVAVLGGGAAPSPQVADVDPRVCSGEACRGPIRNVAPPSIGSVTFAGAGNVLTALDPITPSVTVKKLKPVTGSSATLKVRVPGAGRITVSGTSLRRAAKPTSQAGSYAVKVALSERGKRALRRNTSLKVSVRVAYRSSDGQSASKSVSVTFKQPKVKKSTASKKGGR